MDENNAPQRTYNGKPMRWQDPAGDMHAVDGDEMVRGDRGTFILWTVCGMSDVPANSAWTGNDEVDCAGCLAKLRGEDWEPSEAQQGLIPIPEKYDEQ